MDFNNRKWPSQTEMEWCHMAAIIQEGMAMARVVLTSSSRIALSEIFQSYHLKNKKVNRYSIMLTNNTCTRIYRLLGN